MFARRASKRLRRDQRGVALVEFALLLPFLAMIVFGTVDLSRGFSQQNRLKNASREGAAVARTRPNQLECPDGVKDQATSEDSGSLPTGFAVRVIRESTGFDVTQTCGPVAPGSAAHVTGGETVIVRVEATFDLVTPFVGIVTGDPIDQRAETKVVVQG